MISYLLSNVDWNVGFDDILAGYLQKDILESNKIAYIPTTYDNKGKTERYCKSYSLAFQRIGKIFNESVVLDIEMSSSEVREHIMNASVVFLMGGDTLQQFEYLKSHDLLGKQSLFNCVVLGISAGAMNLCSNALLTSEHPTENVYIYKGLGLVDITVEVHFENIKKQIDLLKESSKHYTDIYCISDNSSIRVEQGRLTFIGEGIYLYKNNKITRC